MLTLTMYYFKMQSISQRIISIADYLYVLAIVCNNFYIFVVRI